MLTSKVCFSEPNSSKDVRIKSFIFLNSTLFSKILLRKLDRTRAQFWQRKRYWPVVAIPAPQEYIGLIMSLELCSLRWQKFNRRLVSNFKPGGSDIENVEFSLTSMNLAKYFLNLWTEFGFLKLSFNFFYLLILVNFFTCLLVKENVAKW